MDLIVAKAPRRKFLSTVSTTDIGVPFELRADFALTLIVTAAFGRRFSSAARPTGMFRSANAGLMSEHATFFTSRLLRSRRRARR